jgi:hypothetical protein
MAKSLQERRKKDPVLTFKLFEGETIPPPRLQTLASLGLDSPLLVRFTNLWLEGNLLILAFQRIIKGLWNEVH